MKRWKRLLYAGYPRCLYCGGKFGPKLRATLDHMTPLSRGGKDKPFNVAVCCEPCNGEKASFTWSFWVSLHQDGDRRRMLAYAGQIGFLGSRVR